nr:MULTISPECIES: helix-turn-helix domain-containing protein [unclassified Streptomyces]
MVLPAAQGMPVAKTAEVTFTSADRVRDVIHNFNADGFASLYPKYKGGRPKTFTLPERREIKKIAKSKPTEHDLPFSTRSLTKPADFLVAEGVVDDISHEGLRILLREEGVSLQRLKTWKTSRDPGYAARKARVEHLCAIADGDVVPEDGEPVVLASSVRVHAHVLTREKHTAQAVTLVRHTAGQLAGAYDQRPPRYLAAVGLLFLRGVTAASTAGDRAAAREFLDEARDVARYVALDQPDAWANFSPTNLSLHAVSAAVAFGDAGIALNTAAPLMRRHIPVPERRAAVWVEVARAYNQQGRLAEGYQALRIAETCAAQDVRRPAVRDLVADMAARDRRRTLPELHHFSRRLGVPAWPHSRSCTSSSAPPASRATPTS